jgi:hypothetical protein
MTTIRLRVRVTVDGVTAILDANGNWRDYIKRAMAERLPWDFEFLPC